MHTSLSIELVEVLAILVRTHLVCPYSDCIAHFRSDPYRIQVLIDNDGNVQLQKPKDIPSARLSYKYKKWIKSSKCPYCQKTLEVVIDETHEGRNINLRLPKQ